MSVRVLAIVQARFGSTRLPGKSMRIIAGDPMLMHVLKRAQSIIGVHQVVLATTEAPEDEALIEVARSAGIACVRGKVEDVLDRFRSTLLAHPADVIVRVTGDCPLLDPDVQRLVLDEYLRRNGNLDYISNVDPPTYPDGLDAEVFSSPALERAWREARSHAQREHVTLYMRESDRGFRRSNVHHCEDLSAHRWTVDEEADLDFVREIYSALAPKGERIFGMAEVLALLRERPELSARNAGIRRNEGLERSRALDLKG